MKLEVVNTCTHVACDSPSERPGRLAAVGIGNPLREEDSRGPRLVSMLSRHPAIKDTCCVNLEINHGWLGTILENHETVVVVDTVASQQRPDDCSLAGDGFLLLPLTADVLNNCRDLTRSSHGLSWLDEVRLQAGSPERYRSLFLFGIAEKADGVSGRGKDKQEHSELEQEDTLLNRLLGELFSILEEIPGRSRS